MFSNSQHLLRHLSSHSLLSHPQSLQPHFPGAHGAHTTQGLCPCCPLYVEHHPCVPHASPLLYFSSWSFLLTEITVFVFLSVCAWPVQLWMCAPCKGRASIPCLLLSRCLPGSLAHSWYPKIFVDFEKAEIIEKNWTNTGY